MSSPLLTLPPQVGRHYRYRNVHDEDDTLHTCEIVEEETYQGITIYRAADDNCDEWAFWPDGKAKIEPFGKEDYCAILVEDAYISTELPESSEHKELMAKREKMMNRLKELGV
jgi:hypothetical protein